MLIGQREGFDADTNYVLCDFKPCRHLQRLSVEDSKASRLPRGWCGSPQLPGQHFCSVEHAIEAAGRDVNVELVTQSARPALHLATTVP